MADNDQNPKTKVNPLTAGLGLEGLKGYNTQDQTQEIKKESQVYTITRNDGTQVNRSYDELSADEKRAVASSGVVAGGKTDIEQKYSVVPDSVGVRPTRTVAPGSGLGTITSIVAPVLLGARKGVPGIIAGGVVGTISAITAGANAAKEEQKYQDALREFNQKVSDSAVIAGDWDKDEDGSLIFMPDYSKVGEGINVAESGAKVADLFDLEGGSEPNVFFSDDGVLHIDIDRTFADTEEYKEIINSISSDYAGLTKDTAGVDEYLNGFKQWLSSALNQYRFEVNRVAGYRSQLPNASVEAIMDASRNEIGAMLADADKKDWTVKVYRDGEIVESNAEEVLDHVLNMKDKYERDDYIETLGDMLQDDSISDDNKAYILSEYNLLFSASDADVKEGGADEERKKYSEMLDQDFFVTLFRGSSVIRGLDNLADGIAGHVSQGEVDDILIANQNYLEPEEVASNFSAVVGTAFDIYISQKIMQGLENKVVRPVLGAASKSIGKGLISTGSEVAGKVGKKLVESSYSAVTDSAGNVIKYRTALDITNAKNHALNNVIQAFGNETSGLSYRLLAKGGAQVLLWSLGELAINFASDALYDATKLGTAVISGEIDSEDEAYQYVKDALGQDLVMDLVLQYGPQGMLDIHTTSDAIRLQNVEPYARGVAEARTKYGEALNAVDAARASKATKKEISRLESEVTARKNDLTKAEVEYADARKKYVGGSSQKFGAKLAEIESRLSENEMYRKFQEAVVDDNAAGTAMARAAYAASGGDVELFNKLMNSVSNNLRTLTRITANELSSDKWAKGTGDALNAFKQKYSELANYFGKISKADDDYIKARNELIRYTEAAKGDKKQIAAAEAFYSKWINAVGRDRAVQLDELMDTMRNVINKTNESAIKAGIQTEENIQTKRNATGFQEQGYIPMYLKRKNKNSHYVIPQERNLDHTWDRGEFWDIDNLENPVLNTLTYVNYTARNIAVNERNKAIIAASEIPGMRTHRTDADNEIIRTEDGHVYKHSDIIGHMEPKIDQRLAKLGKVKKEAPTELEFSDEKDRILYGKVGGTHEELVDELNAVRTDAEKAQAANIAEHMKIETTDNSQYVTRTAGKGKNFNYDGYLAFGREQLTPRSLVGSPAEAFVLMPIRPGGDIDWFNGDIRRGAFAEGGQGNLDTMVDVVIQNFGDGEMLDGRILRKFGIDDMDELASYQDSIDVNDSGFRGNIADLLRNGNYTLNEPRTLYKGVSKKGNHVNTSGDFSWMDTGDYNDESFQFVTLSEEAAKSFFGDGDNYILRYHLPAGQGVFYFGNVDRGYNNGGAMVLPPITGAIATRTGETSSDGVEYLDIYVGDTSPQYRLDGTNADIVEGAEKQRGNTVILYRGQRSRGNNLSANEWSERFAGYDQNPVENTSWWSSDQEYPKNIAGENGQVIKMGIPRTDVVSADDVAKDVKDAIRYKYGYVTERDPSNGGEYFVVDADKKGLNSFRKGISGEKAAYYNELISDSVISPSDLNELNRAASGRGAPSDGNDFESFVNVRSVLDFYNKPVAEFKDGEYVFNTERNPDYYAEHASAAEAPEDALRADVNNRIDALKKYYNDTYSKFGYTTGVRVSQTKIDAFIERDDFDGLATYLEGLKDRASLARPTDQEISDTVFNKQVAGLEIELKRSMNKNFPGLDNEQKREVYARILGEFRRKAAESGDITAKQVAEETFARNVGYPINYFENGEEKTAYIDGPLAKPVYELCVRSENVTDRNFIQKTFEGAAKLKRYTTTAIDATRALPNLLRDTLRGDIMSGGTDYAGARKIFAEILDAENLTAKQKADAMKSIELAIRVAQGETLNAAVENRTERGLQDMVRETRQEGKNAVSRVIWDVAHLRLGHALETPMNIAEMSTRRRMAQSAYVREFKNAKYTSTSFDERLSKAYDAGINAGLENTTNFSRRGTAVGVMARYVPYFQQNFANIESANNAFLKDPAGVASRAALFSYVYVMMLADTLKKEETRRAYYNLSDYDRKNNIVFSLDGDTLVTIPLDESLSALVTPWRRTVETLNNVDPGAFASIFTDTLLEFMPIDLDGFTEGDGLNVRRGVERLASQMAPSLATEMMQTITGYDLYYGSDNAVTDESLAQYGQTAQSAGDYTTASANSKLLRKIADATGIPQWQLQQTVANFGGNVGQYVLNILDKLAGASKDEQGGKEFIKATFKSMTGTDSTNARNQFYNGISELRKEKAKVVNKLDNLNDQISVSSGAELADLKRQYQNVKDDYAMKVSNFVEQYLNAYEITGGLEKSQANQIYYLFNLYDDDTVYQSGSVGEYYQNLARQQARNEAGAWAAPVLDKYYDQTQNVYKDASGVWHYYSPYGEQSYYNTLYGQGMKHQVGLRNLIEGVTSGLKSARSDAYEARSAAMENKDYDLYDQIGADFDAQVVELITPYIKEYGADNVLGNSSVLDYLEEWFFVPSSYMKTNKNRYVPSLAHNASKQRAFVRSYIKSLYGVDTGYTPTERKSLLNPEVF